MKLKSEKTILLINKSISLNKVFKKSLKEEGFNVVSFFDEPIPNFKKKGIIKYVNVFRRLVFKDKEYLQRKEKEYTDDQYVRKAQFFKNKEVKFDYTLFFRADLFSEKMIKEIRKQSEIMITYQYDGMIVSENILNYISVFDKIFVFDKFDLNKYSKFNFFPLTNCWFPDEDIETNEDRDFFYVGVGTDDRQKKIKQIYNYIKDYNFSLQAFLTIPNFRSENIGESIKLVYSGLSYKENMDFVKTSKALLDFKLPYHEGLSFRFFEAMNYEKKLITNNYSVKNYDFYHPNNIFICDFEDFSGLEDFMKKPYHKIKEGIKSKYAFKNWIRYVLNFGEYQKIRLP